MLSVVLFDLDGTLLDSAPCLIACAEQAVARYTSADQLSRQDVRAYVSQGARGMLAYMLGTSPSDKLLESVLFDMLALYDATCHQSSLFAGIDELLTVFKTQRRKWGIVTNKRRRFTHKIITHYPLLQDAKVLICSDDVKHSKPHPEGIVRALTMLGHAADDCWYLGDDVKDMVAGKAAGCRVAFAAYGYAKHRPDDVPITLNAPLELLVHL